MFYDMHQYLCARKFGGQGAPSWTVARYAPKAAGMRQAISDFWANSDVQGHLMKVWMKVAQYQY